ncbi:MAG: MFS transporter [Solirubrobacterales bacterium]
MRLRRSDALLIVVCLAQFMVILDIAIVNVALPSIQDSLHFSDTGLQWVVNAYTLVFAGTLMLGGRASDLLRRRTVFLGGMGLFAAASLVCALADTQGLLVGARALQGLGAAVISAASLAIVTSSFAEGAERNRALGLWAAMGGIGGSAGVLLGGILTEAFSWPAIFFLNVPIGIAVLLAGRRLIPVEGAADHERSFDFAGAVLISGGLSALVYGIVRTDTLGWGAAGVLLPIAGGLLALAAFVLVEGRIARDPLIPLDVFRMPQLRAANLIVALLFSALFGMWFFVSLYLQKVQGDDALLAGISFLPMTLAVFVASATAPKLVARFGVRLTLVLGMSMATIGFLILATITPTSDYEVAVLPGGVLAAFGAGWSLVPSTIVAVKGVPAAQNGLASGVVNTSRLVGGTLGLAVLSTLATSHTNGLLNSGHGAFDALTDGYKLAFLISAGVCALGILAAATLIRRTPDPVPQAA